MTKIIPPKITVQDVLTIGNSDLELDVSEFKLTPQARKALCNLRTQTIADKLQVNSGNFLNNPEALTRLLLKSDIELITYDYLLELNDTNLTLKETGEDHATA